MHARNLSVRISATTRDRLEKLAKEYRLSVPNIVETLSYATNLEMHFLSEDRRQTEKKVKR